MNSGYAGVNIFRGDLIECYHKASIVVVKNSQVILSCGNKDLHISMRSTAKPFMILPFIEMGMIDKYGISDEELCLMMSSHNGEKIHRDTVENLLNKANLSAADLKCGTHALYFEWLNDEFYAEPDKARRQLFHNCSGKHAFMLLLAKAMGDDLDNYYEISHPLQKLIEKRVRQYLEIKDVDFYSIGLDGCGVPNYFITLEKLAYAYQKLGYSSETRKIYDVIVSNPYMIAGKDRIETDLMKKHNLLAKSGSEGLFCITIPQENMGIALKIEDGHDEAAESLILEVLFSLGFVGNDMDKYRYLDIYTSNGIKSGFYQPYVKWR